MAERDKRLREIAAELKRIRALPTSELPDDALHQLITARNWLRAIQAVTPEVTYTSKHKDSGD